MSKIHFKQPVIHRPSFEVFNIYWDPSLERVVVEKLETNTAKL